MLAGVLAVLATGAAFIHMAAGQQALADTAFVFSEGSPAYNILKKDSIIKATAGESVVVKKAEVNIYKTNDLSSDLLYKVKNCKYDGPAVSCVINGNDIGKKLDDEGAYWLYMSGEGQGGKAIEGAWLEVVVDNTAPVVDTTMDGQVNAPVNGTQFHVGVDYGASGYGSLAAQVRDGAGVTAEGVKIDCSQEGVCRIVEGIGLLKPGASYGLWVAATDAAGNKSEFRQAATVNTAPAKPVITSVTSDGKNVMNGYTKFNGVVTTWTGAEGAAKYQYGYWNDIAGNKWKQGNMYTTSPTTSMSHPGTFTEGQGKHYVAVRSISSVGVVSDWATAWVVYDVTAPTVDAVQFYKDHTMSAMVATGGFTNSKAFAFNLSASEDTSRYQLKYWNDIATSSFKEFKPWAPSDLAKAGKMSAIGVYKDVFTQGDGAHYFSFSACDAAGNCSKFTEPFVVIYDSTRPDAQLKIEGTSYKTSDTVTVTGWVTDEPNIKSHWFEVKTPNGEIYYHRVANNAVPLEVSFTLNTSYGPGRYAIRYVVEDKAGNRSDDPKYTNTIVKTVEIKDTELPKTNDPEYIDDADSGSETTENTGDSSGLNSQTSGGGSEDVNGQGQSEAATAPIDATSLARSLATRSSTAATGEVLGVTTEDNEANEESTPVVAMNNDNSGTGRSGSVLAAEDERASGPWSLIGSFWYFWLALFAGLAWWIIAAVRRRREDDQYFAS